MDFSISNDYRSSQEKFRSFPSLRFYFNLALIMYRAGKVARLQAYSGERWVYDSICVARAIEHVGAIINIEGISHLDVEGPCIFESNHMSTLETMLLPGVIQPRKDVTFVIKKSLLSYPCLGPVLSARKPIALGRKNPREDLKLVMEQGTQIIDEGRSLIIFTQGTRRRNVDTSDFNSLAVKLAKKTHVPIIPIALKTDAWGEGNVLKDFGKINPAIPIHIRFGEPIYISASGKEEHEHILRFIKNQFNAWT